MAGKVKLQATSVATLLESIRMVRKDIGQNEDLWFRGHACGRKWKLVPNVHRHYDKHGEQQLLIQFQVQAPSRYDNCPNINDYPAWTALGQHYGLPTRLLDWTGSPLVAAYFASLECDKNQVGIIWVINPGKMTSLMTGKDSVVYTFRADECSHMIHAGWFTNPQARYKYVASVPDELDFRLILQQSYFTVHSDAMALEEHNQADSFLRKIFLPLNSKVTIKEELEMLGFRQSTLFPDLSNLAECLRSRIKKAE